MNKRGLSAVVTMVIMILLVLVAIGLLWLVVKNFLDEGTDNISAGLTRIDLQIKNIKIEDSNFFVRVERGTGEGELTKIKFSFTDGEIRKTDEANANDLKILEGQLYKVNLQELEIIEISVAPVIKTESGEEHIGQVTHTYELSDDEILQVEELP